MIVYVLITIFTGIVVVFCTHLFTRYRDWISKRNVANREFNDVLASDLRKILDGIEDPNLIIAAAETNHHEAMIKFRPHLLFYERRPFDKAWCTYYYCENSDIACLGQYMDGGSLAKRRELVPLFQQRINDVLLFARHKKF